MAGEAGVVEGDGIPLVPGVDVDGAGVEEISEAVEVAGARGGKNVAVWNLLEGDGGAEIGGGEVDTVEVRVHGGIGIEV